MDKFLEIKPEHLKFLIEKAYNQDDQWKSVFLWTTQ